MIQRRQPVASSTKEKSVERFQTSIFEDLRVTCQLPLGYYLTAGEIKEKNGRGRRQLVSTDKAMQEEQEEQEEQEQEEEQEEKQGQKEQEQQSRSTRSRANSHRGALRGHCPSGGTEKKIIPTYRLSPKNFEAHTTNG
jgi:hypothetical protein